MALKDTIQNDEWQDSKIPVFTSLRVNADPDNLEQHELVQASNVRFLNDKIVESLGYAQYHTTVLSGDPMDVHRFLSNVGTKTSYLFTTSAVYFDTGTAWSEIITGLSGSIENPVSVVSIPWSNEVVFTNGIDPIKVINTETNTISDLTVPDGISTCKAVAVFDSSLWLLYTTEDGDDKPQRARASEQGDITIWEGGNSFSQDLLESTEPIIRGEQLASYLIIYRKRGIHRVTKSNNPLKRFDIDQMIPDQGIQSYGSVVPIEKNQHVFWGNDNFYRYNGGFGLEPIGLKIRELIFGESPDEDKGELVKRQLLFIEELQQIIAVYQGTGDASAVSAVEGYLDQDSWNTRQFSHPVRGYSRISSDISIPWDDLVGNWEDLEGSWNDMVIGTGEPLIVFCSDSATYQLQLDAVGDLGVSQTKLIETKDFSEYPYEVRMDWIDVKIQGFLITIEYSTDEAVTWQTFKEFEADPDIPQVYRIFGDQGQIVYESIRFRIQSDDDGFEFHSMSLRVAPESEAPIRVAQTATYYILTEAGDILAAENDDLLTREVA